MGFCNGTCADIKWVAILALNDVTTARVGYFIPHTRTLIDTQVQPRYPQNNDSNGLQAL